MDLIKGDWGSLEGKVTIFSVYIGKSQNAGKYANTPFALSTGMVFAVYAELETGRLRSARTFPFTHYPVPVDSRQDVVAKPRDILFTGEFNHFERCRRANVAGVEYYSTMLEEQVTGGKIKRVSYLDIQPAELEKYITDAYITPMIDASIKSDAAMLGELKRDFERFSINSPFTRDVSNLCSILQAGDANPNTKLLGAYVQKIGAIATENYEIAAVKSRVIEQLTDKLSH